MLAFIRRSILKPIAMFPVSWPKIWGIFRAGLTAIPVMLLAYLRFDFGGIEPTHQAVQGWFSDPWKAVPLIVASGLISIFFDLYETLGEYVRDKQTDHVPNVFLTKTLAGLNSIVGMKLDRLGRSAKAVRGDKLDRAKLLDDCTQPEQQIEEIVKQIWLVMTSLTESPNLEIVLVSTNRNGPLSYAGYMPQAKKPKDELLSANDSFFAHVARTGVFQCIEDIARHVQRQERLTNTARKNTKFVPFHVLDSDSESGSICGFPVHDSHLNAIAFVLTIKHEQPGVVTKSFRKKYGPLLDNFFMRILLENNLMRIKSHAG